MRLVYLLDTPVLIPILLAIKVITSDEKLIERLRQRDPRAMAELYDRYGRLVYSLTFRIVKDRAVAEDLVQETFFRIWTRAQSIHQKTGALGPWLLTVARNRAIDYFRSALGRERNAVPLLETHHPALYNEIESELVASDKARRVRAAMDKLAPNYREVMELAYFEGMSQSEMAEKLGQPLGTIKTWVRAALRSLRAELGVVIPS